MSILGCGYAHNINKLIHRPEEGLDLKSECIVVSAMVHLSHGMKLWFTNKHGKVVLNKKTNGLRSPCLLAQFSVY